MAHELGHCLSPSLTGEDAEDFADGFVGALLFPKDKEQNKPIKIFWHSPLTTKKSNV